MYIHFCQAYIQVYIQKAYQPSKNERSTEVERVRVRKHTGKQEMKEEGRHRIAALADIAGTTNYPSSLKLESNEPNSRTPHPPTKRTDPGPHPPREVKATSYRDLREWYGHIARVNRPIREGITPSA